MKYDVVIPVAGKDIGFISKVVKYIRQCFNDADAVSYTHLRAHET